MVRHAPKLLVAGAITGLTDTAHVVSTWLSRLLPESWLASPLEEIGAWALAISSIFILIRTLKPLGKLFRRVGDACIGFSNALENSGAWLAQRIERLIRRGLIRLAAGLRHVGLKLAR